MKKIRMSTYTNEYKLLFNNFQSHIELRYLSKLQVHMGMEISLTCQIGGLPQGLKYIVNPLWSFDLDCSNIFYSQFYQSLAPWQFLLISCILVAFVQSLLTCKKDRNLQN